MVIVIGAGPAGIMASIRAAQSGAAVILLERNNSAGQKLLLTGKGRCNLTNACPHEEFLFRFSGNRDFLRDAFKKFSSRDLLDFFRSRGLKLTLERQQRVFPADGKAAGVLSILKNELAKNKVEIRYSSRAQQVAAQGCRAQGVKLHNGEFLAAEKVILATGGVSYSFTGSSGDGLKMAEKLGHKIVPLLPGLVPLEIEGGLPEALEGLTLKNIRLQFIAGKNKIVTEIGDLLFTAFGVSGPLVLSASGRLAQWLEQGRQVWLGIDLKPGLSAQQLDLRLQREIAAFSRKSAKNMLKELLPLRMIPFFLAASKIAPEQKCAQISRAQREALARELKGLRLRVRACRPIEEAMVTRGGVSLKEINPRTMESRLIKGLYFCGEMLDVDADTGGFNLQAAFSTGYLAGESAAPGKG